MTPSGDCQTSGSSSDMIIRGQQDEYADSSHNTRTVKRVMQNLHERISAKWHTSVQGQPGKLYSEKIL